MTDGYVRVQPDSSGKRLQTYANTVSTVEVHAEAFMLVDSTGTPNKVVDNKLRISSMPYLYDIAEGNVSGHTPWSKIGYNPALVASTEADLWSKAGTYAFPTSAAKLEVVSSSAGDEDTGTSIFSGNSTGGSTTSLIDATKNFTAGTPVAAGDCIILDKSGTSPEWGYVTSVAATTLTVAGGFSSGGSGSGRAYTVVDKSARTGAQAVKIEYLTDTYAEKTELVLLDGNASVDTVNTDLYRVNSFRVIAVGSNLKPVGNLTLQADGAGTTYSYITLGYTRARNAQYTVPAGKTLYVTNFTCGYAYSHNSTHYCRIYTRANIESQTGFNTKDIFYPYTEVIASNATVAVDLPTPTKLPAGTDIKVSAVADYAGIATIVLRGWLET